MCTENIKLEPPTVQKEVNSLWQRPDLSRNRGWNPCASSNLSPGTQTPSRAASHCAPHLAICNIQHSHLNWHRSSHQHRNAISLSANIKRLQRDEHFNRIVISVRKGINISTGIHTHWSINRRIGSHKYYNARTLQCYRAASPSKAKSLW